MRKWPPSRNSFNERFDTDIVTLDWNHTGVGTCIPGYVKGRHSGRLARRLGYLGVGASVGTESDCRGIDSVQWPHHGADAASMQERCNGELFRDSGKHTVFFETTFQNKQWP
jgi:hypothetical protein